MRLLLWPLALPFRVLAWLFRRAYVFAWGYNVLELTVRGRLPDRHPAPSLRGFVAGGSGGPSLLELLAALERAKRDERIRVVFVRVGQLQTGLARVEEVRQALLAVRAAGKRVVAYVEEAGLAEYGVALGASEIVLPESGGLGITGVASQVLLVKGLLDRVGVRAWLRARGKYKTFRETFGEDHMTPENREMTESIVSDLGGQLVRAISSSRGIPEAEVRAVLDRGPLLAEEAKAAGFVDRLAYDDVLEKELEGSLPKYRALDLGTYLSLSRHLVPRGRPARIALLEVKGHIKGGSGEGDQGRATSSAPFVRAVRRAAEDRRIRAILLRVDSPGGSALASDLMWHALSEARAKKPIVVSMGDVAASGGYFVAGIRDTPVLASAATITGSIGVVAGKFDLSGLYERLGIQKVIVGDGKRAGVYSEARGFSDDELAKLDADLDAHYRHFLSRMAEGRGKTVDQIHEVAQGRVFTGKQALANGLVDEEGGLAQALARVRLALGLAPEAPLALLGAARPGWLPFRLAWKTPESLLPEALRAPLRLAEYFSRDRVLALLPFDVRFR